MNDKEGRARENIKNQLSPTSFSDKWIKLLPTLKSSNKSMKKKVGEVSRSVLAGHYSPLASLGEVV